MEQSKGGGGGVGEVRRVHVVYFLCRDGKIEHPHLIRVHHLHHNGVHLRDVKRWLSELRGKDMPEYFAWSYKRRYKAGYVWQDLMDDDLITPISDNEYVLKGSDLSHMNNESPFETAKHDPDVEAVEVADAKLEVPPPKPSPETLQIEPDNNASPKPPPQLDQESPGPQPDPHLETPPPSGSDAPDISVKGTAAFKVNTWRQHEGEEKREEVEKKQPREPVEDGVPFNRNSLRGRGHHQGSGRRAPNVICRLLGCKVAEANDPAVLAVRRPGGHRMANGDISLESWSHIHQLNSKTPKLNKSNNRMISRNYRSMKGGKSSRKTGEKAVSAVYKPVGEPNCSQCGKAFKPEKMHSHMKSCKALRGARKG